MKTILKMMFIFAASFVCAGLSASQAAINPKLKQCFDAVCAQTIEWTNLHEQLQETISIAIQSKDKDKLTYALCKSLAAKCFKYNLQAIRPDQKEETLAQFAQWLNETTKDADPNDYKKKGKAVSEMFPAEWKELMEILTTK